VRVVEVERVHERAVRQRGGGRGQRLASAEHRRLRRAAESPRHLDRGVGRACPERAERGAEAVQQVPCRGGAHRLGHLGQSEGPAGQLPCDHRDAAPGSVSAGASSPNGASPNAPPARSSPPVASSYPTISRTTRSKSSLRRGARRYSGGSEPTRTGEASCSTVPNRGCSVFTRSPRALVCSSFMACSTLLIGPQGIDAAYRSSSHSSTVRFRKISSRRGISLSLLRRRSANDPKPD